MMFSFLRTRVVSVQKARIISTRSTMQHSMRICSFCHFHHFKSPKPIKYTMLRHYATSDTKQLEAPWKKKAKYRSKKYTELLEVTDQVTSNKKAAVRKLNSAHVSILVNQPDITLDKLHKINHVVSRKEYTTQTNDTETGIKKNSEDNVNDLHYTILEESSGYLENEMEVVEELKESNINDHTLLIKNSSFVNTLHQIDIEGDQDENHSDSDVLTQQMSNHEVIPDYAIPFTKEKDPFEDSLSDKNIVSQLLAHMDVYIQTGMLNQALKMLMLKRHWLRKCQVSTTSIYNLLMEGYVSKPHLDKVFEVYKIMKEDSVKSDVHTYALMFEIIGNMKIYKKQEEKVIQVVADMNDRGVTFDDIMNTTQINAAQYNAILKCIRMVDPQYHITYRDIDTEYNCKLLGNLMNDNNYQCPADQVLNIDELRKLMHTQMDMEKQHALEVQSIASFTGDPYVRQQAREQIEQWDKTWESSVSKAFNKNLTYLKQKEIRLQPDFKALYLFLQVLPKEEYIGAILREVKQLSISSDSYSDSLPHLYVKLGKHIYHKYELQRKRKAGIMENITRVYDEYLKWYMQQNPTDRDINGRIKWQQLAQEFGRSGIRCDMTIPEWPYHVLINVGKFLYNIIINDVKIAHKTKANAPSVLIPAFYLIFRNKSKYLIEEIKPHPQLYKTNTDSHSETLRFDTILLPTCTPPRPWVNIDAGGYLFSKANLIRDPYVGMGSTYLLKKTKVNQLYPALDCLNQLGSIPWMINQPILDILIQIFREDGSEELNVPSPPSILPPLSVLIQNEQNKEGEISRNKISRLALQLRRRKNEMYSLWCDCLYKLSLANHFRDKMFWLPHNLDFRGRAYPVPPHLNHLSSDLGRSILQFAQGKPLGPTGLDWLKIHTINLTGMKKREPIHKRLEFANEVLDQIIDSARNPLTGEMWWTKSDEPWQTLAACKEIDYALQSPNVEEYVCRLPIHQDGSCNGLQHYAALGRDQVGAESVNLYPSSTPQDVYSVVVAMVEEYRKKDAEDGNEIAKILEGHISRKVIKQTVMTTVYGVTKFGARLQITRQLSDLKNFDQNYTWAASLYLVEMTFKSLRTMFTSAKEIQDWFTECARFISTRCNQYVQWVTPLGLPVLQPYCKRTRYSHYKILKKPDTLKQKNAFPPNFIHSLDSSHMMLTSLHCEKAGITFMSVHDCFWTHPCSVEVMNKICREQFVMLHSEPILENLSKVLSQRYSMHLTNEKLAQRKKKDTSVEVFKNLPKKGDFDIKKVLSSQYFFS